MGPVHALTTHKHSSFRPHCLAATHDTRLRLVVIVIVIVICVVIVVLYESGRWREELEDAELEEREAEELGSRRLARLDASADERIQNSHTFLGRGSALAL